VRLVETRGITEVEEPGEKWAVTIRSGVAKRGDWAEAKRQGKNFFFRNRGVMTAGMGG